jgi:hypothetical protein
MNDYLKERELWWPVSPELMASYKDGSHTEELGDGTLRWFKNDRLHRDGDNPAWIYQDGTLAWFKNNQRHRDGDKPAWIGANGTIIWYKNGQRHRMTGPATINQTFKFYWVNGIEITSEVESWLKTRKYKYPFTPEQQVEFTLTFG